MSDPEKSPEEMTQDEFYIWALNQMSNEIYYQGYKAGIRQSLQVIIEKSAKNKVFGGGK